MNRWLSATDFAFDADWVLPDDKLVARLDAWPHCSPTELDCVADRNCAVLRESVVDSEVVFPVATVLPAVLVLLDIRDADTVSLVPTLRLKLRAVLVLCAPLRPADQVEPTACDEP